MRKEICDYTSDEEFFKEILNAEEIKEATKETYVYMMKKVTGITGKPLCRSLINAKETFRVLNENVSNKSSLKTILASILAVLKWTGEKEVNKTLFMKWYAYYRPLSKDLLEKKNNNEASVRQAENWIPWPDVLSKLEHLKKTEYGSNRHLLLAMYCLFRPRRQEDYFKVKLLKSVGQRASPEESFVDFISKKPYIVVKHFKTATKYDQWRKEIPDDLAEIIRHNYKDTKKSYLFTSSSGEPFANRNSFTQYSNRILKGLFDPKKVTVNTLRHSFSTYRNADRDLTIGERMQDAKDMGHSLETHLSYALKIEGKK
jgi:hypothetical protein